MTTEYRSSPLTQGNLNNDHIYITPFRGKLPRDAFGGSLKSAPAPVQIRLHWRSASTETEVPMEKDGNRPRDFLRARGFIREFFADAGAQPGDFVVFEKLGSHEFRLHLEKPGGRRIS